MYSKQGLLMKELNDQFNEEIKIKKSKNPKMDS